jgi:hypothetical protein
MRDIRYAAEGVVGRDGDVICVSSVVSETSGGLSMRMTVLDDPELEGVHRAYAHALAARGHFGPLNLQGKKTAAGEFLPYEINGRFTGSVMARTLPRLQPGCLCSGLFSGGSFTATTSPSQRLSGDDSDAAVLCNRSLCCQQA